MPYGHSNNSKNMRASVWNFKLSNEFSVFICTTDNGNAETNPLQAKLTFYY